MHCVQHQAKLDAEGGDAEAGHGGSKKGRDMPVLDVQLEEDEDQSGSSTENADPNKRSTSTRALTTQADVQLGGLDGKVQLGGYARCAPPLRARARPSTTFCNALSCDPPSVTPHQYRPPHTSPPPHDRQRPPVHASLP